LFIESEKNNNEKEKDGKEGLERLKGLFKKKKRGVMVPS